MNLSEQRRHQLIGLVIVLTLLIGVMGAVLGFFAALIPNQQGDDEEAELVPTLVNTATVPTATNTATATPTPAPPSALVPFTVQITSTVGAFIRTGPGTNYDPIFTANPNVQFDGVAYVQIGDTNWYLVALDDTQQGWVSGQVVSIDANSPNEIGYAATIPPSPVPSVVPSPTPSPIPVCGDAICNADENAETCAADCIAFGTQNRTMEILPLINRVRCARGLTPVVANQALFMAAAKHTNDMVTNNFMGHTGTDGSSMAQRIQRAGYRWSYYGENIVVAQPTTEGAFTWWRNSAVHNANLMRPQFTEIGLAYSRGTSARLGHYWTMTFGTRANSPRLSCDAVN